MIMRLFAQREDVMIVIKRYPNRKLYNTNAKMYVTLDGVAHLIRDGEEIQIVDHASGEDLTAVTLTQIIFEQEKKEGGFLPRSLLTGLIQSGGQTLGTMRRSLASPLNLRLHVDLEIERRLKSLVEKGEVSEEEAQQLQEKLVSESSRTQRSSVPSEEELEQLLTERGVPTKDDLQQLSIRLDELVAVLDEVDVNPENDPAEPS